MLSGIRRQTMILATPPETFDMMIAETDLLALLSRYFQAEDRDAEDRALKNEACFICTNLAIANDDKA